MCVHPPKRYMGPPKSMAARKIGPAQKPELVKSTTGRTITAAHNEVEWCDAVESCHVKLPRVGLDGKVHLRWFAVVAHVMPVFLYKFLFAPSTSEIPVALDRERENRPTRAHCKTNWCEVIRGYSIIQLSDCLGRFRKLWTDDDLASTPSVAESEDDSVPDSAASERARSSLTGVSWDRPGAALFPLSLNSLGEEVDSLNTHPDPQNVKVYPNLLLTQTLLQLTVYSARHKEETAFRGGPFDIETPKIRADLRRANKSEVVFPPDNGGLEIEYGKGTRYPFLNETHIESISLLSLFRELRGRASALNQDRLADQVRILWFQLCEVAYKRRRQAHIENGAPNPDLSEAQKLALFDVASEASAVVRF